MADKVAVKGNCLLQILYARGVITATHIWPSHISNTSRLNVDEREIIINIRPK